MASIISYFGSLGYNIHDSKLLENLPGYNSWVGSRVFSENLGMFSKPDQLRFYVEQALALAYFRTMFGGRCHDSVNEYMATVAANATAFMDREQKELGYGSYPRIFEALTNILKFVKNGGRWVDVPIGLIVELLSSSTPEMELMPRVYGTVEKLRSLVSFLIWMNELPQEGYRAITGEIGVMVPYMVDHWDGPVWCATVRYDYFRVGQTFSSTIVEVNDKVKGVALLSYLCHFDLSTISLESIIGLLSQFAFHTDVNRAGLTPTHLLAIAVRYGVTREVSFSGDSPFLENDGAHMRSCLFEVTSAFVNWYVSAWHVETIDKEILYRTFFTLADSKEQKSAAAYLKQADASPSAESWKAFKTILPGCESLQLISQNPTGVDAALDATVVSKDDADGTGGSDDNPEPSDPNQGDEGSGSQDDQNDNGDESGNDEPEEPAEDLDEQTEETDDDPTDPPDEGEGDSSENTGEDTGSSSEEETDDTTTIHNESSQPELNLSDKRGIILEWTKPEDETINTALFREEINTLLSDILANPPKKISAQNLATLMSLKRYWLYSLRVESIVGILESCIRIPLTTKKLKSIGVINNEL